MHELKLQGKSHDIPKRLIWEAWLKVEGNGGAAGPDGVTIDDSQGVCKTTCINCGIACRRGRIFPVRSVRWKYRKMGAESGSSVYQM